VALCLGLLSTTPASGARPVLSVSRLTMRVDSGSATIRFETGVPSRVTVELGTDASYGLQLRDSGSPGQHAYDVRGLKPATRYVFRITARLGRTVIRSPGSFTTAAPIQAPVAASAGRAVTVDGDPFFPIMTWAQCAADVDANLSLGIDVFMGSTCDEAALAAAVAGRAYVVGPLASGTTLPGEIGVFQPDEPDGYRIPAADLAQPPGNGLVTFLTVTSHFWSGAADLGWLSKADYGAYFAKADVVGTDLYPVAEYCTSPGVTLGTIFDLQRELVALGKPSYQWIETTPIDGRCAGGGWPALASAILRAEVWLAVAGGATGLGFFTWNGGLDWQRFEIAPSIAAQIAVETGRIAAIQPALLAPETAVTARPGGLVRVGARLLDGTVYTIAVNTSAQAVGAGFRVPALGSGRATVWHEGRTVRIRHGVIGDRFQPYAVHVYVASAG
jgi:hypothetical protein